MTFKLKLAPRFRRRLDKLAKKDKALAVAVRKKIDQIINFDEATIHHFKNLRHDMSEYKRAHVGSFVLFFKLEGDTVAFDKLIHHDDAY